LGLFDFFKQKDTTVTEQRNVYGQTIIGNLFGSSSGENVSKEQALRIAAVWSCVRVLSETIASLPISLYEKDADNRKQVLSNNPLNTLVGEQPSPLFNSFMFFERILVDLSLDGNFYAFIERNAGGLPIGLHPIKCDDVDVFISPKGRGVYYEIKQNDADNIYPKVGKVQSIDMIHVKGLSFDGIVGKSPIHTAAETLGISIALDKHAGAFFKNGASVGGILKHPGTLKPETAKRLRESWSSNYSGTDNTGKTAILEEGMDFVARTIPNNQAQFLESRQYQISDICRIFRVPNHLVNDLSNATYSNIEAQQIDFVVHTITPWIKRIESELNSKLVPFKKRGVEYFKFNLNAILRGDSKARADYYRTLVNIGVMSPDEVRKLEDLNSIGGASEDYYMQSNMLPINRLGESTSREDLNKNIEDDEQEQ
jgi:HK97 family phage portal protein